MKCYRIVEWVREEAEGPECALPHINIYVPNQAVIRFRNGEIKDILCDEESLRAAQLDVESEGKGYVGNIELPTAWTECTIDAYNSLKLAGERFHQASSELVSLVNALNDENPSELGTQTKHIDESSRGDHVLLRMDRY